MTVTSAVAYSGSRARRAGARDFDFVLELLKRDVALWSGISGLDEPGR